VKTPTTVDAARAALYALGALHDDERAAFEERLDASPALRDELAALHEATGELALAPPPVAPRESVRERLLAHVAADARAGAVAAARPPLPDLLFALDAEASWTSIAPGLEHRALSRDASSQTYLLRLAPGHAIPPHEHRRVEHSFVLSGSLDVEGTLCLAGDYHRAAAGTRHLGPYSAEGCVLLVLETPA